MSDEALNIPSIERAGLALSAVAGATARVSFVGSGETGGVEALREFVAVLHSEALRARPAEITVDMVDLKFINSSCLKVLVSWVYDVDTNGRPYKIELVRDTRMHWQKGSLDTLRRLAPEVVRVVDAPQPA